VTSDEFATEAAVRILAQNGSAVDALVAAAAVQCVVENGSTTIAGMWMSKSHDASSRQTTTVTGKIGPADAESYAYEPESAAAYSGRAMPVPGWPAGAYAAWQRSGRLAWADVLEPAIALAYEGFAVDPATYLRVRSSPTALRTKEGRELWMRDGRLIHVGEIVRQSALASTLIALAEGGPAAFYEGEFAANYVAKARDLGGKLTLADMARWDERAVAVPTRLVGDYQGFQVSAEGLLSVYALHLCQAARLESLSGAEAVWAQVRILEETFHACQRFNERSSDEFVDRQYADSRIQDVLEQPLRPTCARQFNSNTNTLAVRDRLGNVAWLTHSINTPNLFGTGVLVGGAYAVRAINSTHARRGDVLAPGLFTDLALFRDGRPLVVAGSPGTACVHAPLAFIVELIQFGLDPATAIAAPRFGLASVHTSERQPFESHYPDEVFAMLENRRLPYFVCSPMIGKVAAIVVGEEQIDAVHDPRFEGTAAVHA
jgi:gamma-glutamyltranspeptidase / glutathione hydrolase